MNENRTRPTKKQVELLNFIAKFVAENGYGPSYREIMVGCDYSSVATVAAHVNNLVANGNLIKKGRSARSLELAGNVKGSTLHTEKVKPSDEKWLVEKIESRFKSAESGNLTVKQVDNLYVLVGCLKVLGFDSAGNSFTSRLKALKNRL